MYGSLSRSQMSRFASSEHAGMGRTLSSLEGIYKRTISRPHTTHLSHGDEFASDVLLHEGGSGAGSRSGTGSMLGSELDLISPESSPGEMAEHRRISPDHRAIFMDDHPIFPISRTQSGSDRGDSA